MLGVEELHGHTFEVVKLSKEGENWLCQFAVDGVLLPPFYEPHFNVVHIPDAEFLPYMQSQALTMLAMVQEGKVAS